MPRRKVPSLINAEPIMQDNPYIGCCKKCTDRGLKCMICVSTTDNTTINQTQPCGCQGSELEGGEGLPGESCMPGYKWVDTTSSQM